MASAENSNLGIKTRFLILSDTHGDEFPDELKPLMSADVAIHCGDLTEESKLDEFERSLQLLRDIDAPLKLVVAGNHDFTLDTSAFERILSNSLFSTCGGASADDEAAVKREFGTFGEAENLFLQAKDEGITLLGEGTHRFELANGAKMTVFASPYTPSKSAGWGFQYIPAGSCSHSPSDGLDWFIQDGTDVVITHGPPHGILDRTCGSTRGGSHDLFTAVERTKPRLHCFGHIHEGWGAKLVTWREKRRGRTDGSPSHFSHVDNERSAIIESLAGLRAGKLDSKELGEEKKQRLRGHRNKRACITSHCAGDSLPLQVGEQTLFVNAAIQGESDGLEGFQLPWVVDVELPNKD